MNDDDLSRQDGSRQDESPTREDGDLSDMLEELRILLPGTQTLTAFLIILPFNNRFNEIRDAEKIVYLITFVCSLVSLMLFVAPAAHHRLERPLRDRIAFKDHATKFMIAGLVPLSIALVLAAHLVVSTVVGSTWLTWSVTAVLAVLVIGLWWVFPMLKRRELQSTPGSRSG